MSGMMTQDGFPSQLQMSFSNESPQQVDQMKSASFYDQSQSFEEMLDAYNLQSGSQNPKKSPGHTQSHSIKFHAPS